MPKQNEEALAKAVVAYVEDLGWDVYQEVMFQGRSADIVAVRGSILWVIECKTSLTLAVLGQAYRWEQCAHMASVATPARRGSRSGAAYDFAVRIMDDYGIGHMEVEEYNSEQYRYVRPVRQPSIRRPRRPQDLRDLLSPEHKTMAAAGTNGGGRWSPFRATEKRAVELVQQHPEGITMAELVAGIDHHYSNDKSARQCIARWITEGVIKGIRAERDGKRLVLKPAELASS